MNVLEKILGEIGERLNMVESIPVNEDDDFLDGEECYEDGRTQGRFKELLWCRDIIRSHMDEARDINVPSNDGWISVDERLPEDDRHILLSFENFSLPLVGRYEENEKGGAFYLGDCDEEDTCISNDLYVNAWTYLPERYKGGDSNA